MDSKSNLLEFSSRSKGFSGERLFAQPENRQSSVNLINHTPMPDYNVNRVSFGRKSVLPP